MWFTRNVRSAPRANARHARPQLEPLEDRLAPAVYTVDRLGDAGAGAGVMGDIRYAVNQANASVGVADTINFNIAGGGVKTITLNNPLTITDPVTIDGYT
jgi:hypothetical protein